MIYFTSILTDHEITYDVVCERQFLICC